jgi:hypothetical protein
MPLGHAFKAAARQRAVALLLCATAFSFTTAVQLSAEPRASTAIEFVTSAAAGQSAEPTVEAAVATFIRGMASADVETVWMFASEEDQDAFGSEQAVYDAFADVFPALTRVQKVTFEGFWREGETPFVTLSLVDGEGVKYRAKIGLWLDDAGDWKLISCQVNAIDDRIAAAAQADGAS